jgi:hypothetical protein
MLRRKKNMVSLLAALAPMGLAVAQTGLPACDPPWYGTTYVSYPRAKGLILEGSVAPSYEVLELRIGAQNASVRVVVTPEVLFQMSAEKSSPIHAPSYKPRLSFYGKWQSPAFTLFPHLTLAHHSNGQDGGVFTSADSAGTQVINTSSGTFSTNFVHAGYFVTFRRFPHHMIGVSFEFHPSRGLFSIDDELRSVYGRKRVYYQYLYARPWLRVEATYTRILDDPQGVPENIYSARLKWRVPGFKKMLWLFAGYYDGQSYYNIHFGERIRQLKTGLCIDARFVGKQVVPLDASL